MRRPVQRALLPVFLVFLAAACSTGEADPSQTVAPSTPIATAADGPPQASAGATATPSMDSTADDQFAATLLGDPDGQGAVRSMTPHGDGLVAVGVEYADPLPILGPTPPHEGRVWSSADGRTWEDATPSGVFENTSLSAVIRRADGSLLIVGTVTAEEDGTQVNDFAAWESKDGRIWTSTQTGLPGERWIRAAVQGERGVLADVWQVGATHGTEIWHSADGRTWEMVRAFGDGFIDFDAGEEGFVVAGTEGPYGEPGTPFAIASADGSEWFEASNPPDGTVSVAAIGSDWVILTVTRDDAFRPTSMATWQSANGLDWSEPRDIDVGINMTEGESGCPLEPSLVGGGGWLILRSFWSGLCSEGAAASFGPHRLSADGREWHELPIPGGHWVNASAVLRGAFVLAGESNGHAAFWLADDR